MKLLYGKYFEARYKAIAEIIPVRATVVEHCAGDAYLYMHYLKEKAVVYTGLDSNRVFVRAAQKKGISFLEYDLGSAGTIPSAEYVIIQASLYQFIPNENIIIRKLLDAAKSALIIAEPIRNLADSNNIFVRGIARYSTNPGKNHSVNRFNKDTLLSCFNQFVEFKEMKVIEGGREMIGIFRK